MRDKIDMTPFMQKHETIDHLKRLEKSQTVFILYHHGQIKRLFNSLQDVNTFLYSIGAVDIGKYWKCLEVEAKRV